MTEPTAPTHSDYRILTDKLNVLNDIGESCASGDDTADVAKFDELMSRYADVPSVDNVAAARAVQILQTLGIHVPAHIAPYIFAAMATAWTEAFYVGNLFHGEKMVEMMDEVTIPDSLEGV